MKRQPMILSLLFLAALALGACGKSDQISQENLDYPYYESALAEKKTINLSFFKGIKNIPYLSIDTLKTILEGAMKDSGESNYVLSKTISGKTITLSRENKVSCSFDFAKGTITFSDYDLFSSLPCAANGLDMDPSSDLNANNQYEYLQRQSRKGFYRPGAKLVLTPKDYDIELYYQKDQGDLPLTMASDFFLATPMPTLAFNGESVFLFPGAGSYGDLSDTYYQVAPKALSTELAAFSYHELCLTLDHLYGLKKQHGISDFDTLFSQNGFKTDFLGTDPKTQDIDYEKLVYALRADFHSNFVGNSPFAGKDSTPARGEGMTTYGSPSYLAKVAAFKTVAAAQAPAFAEGCPIYQVIGDTAYVSFNAFTSASEDYYSKAPTAEAADTFGICAYAHQQITNNSAIKNVVLDLSANTGGDSRAALYTLAWFLGEAALSVQSAATGALATTLSAPISTSTMSLMRKTPSRAKISFVSSRLRVFRVAISFLPSSRTPVKSPS